MDSFNGLDATFAFLGGFLIVFIIIFIALSIFLIVANVKVFQKAGKQGWEAIIPIYNSWVLVEIAGLDWWWFLIVCASSLASIISEDLAYIGLLASLFGGFVVNYNLSKKLHKDTGFAVLMTLVPIIAIPMIAFGKEYQFDHSVEVSKNGPFGGETSKGNNSNNSNNSNKTETKSTKDDETNNDIAYCPNCGAKIEKGTKFCGKCGKGL